MCWLYLLSMSQFWTLVEEEEGGKGYSLFTKATAA